jgi:hypothetical protein
MSRSVAHNLRLGVWRSTKSSQVAYLKKPVTWRTVLLRTDARTPPAPSLILISGIKKSAHKADRHKQEMSISSKVKSLPSLAHVRHNGLLQCGWRRLSGVIRVAPGASPASLRSNDLTASLIALSSYSPARAILKTYPTRKTGLVLT